MQLWSRTCVIYAEHVSMNMDEEEKHRATLSIDLDWSQMTVSVDGRGGHTAGLFIQRMTSAVTSFLVSRV